MTSLLNALDRIATAAMRDQATEILYLDAAGHSKLEIAKTMGISWPTVEVIRNAAGDCIIQAMREDGYADVEIIRTLGVPTARVAPALV